MIEYLIREIIEQKKQLEEKYDKEAKKTWIKLGRNREKSEKTE